MINVGTKVRVRRPAWSELGRLIRTQASIATTLIEHRLRNIGVKALVEYYDKAAPDTDAVTLVQVEASDLRTLHRKKVNKVEGLVRAPWWATLALAMENTHDISIGCLHSVHIATETQGLVWHNYPRTRHEWCVQVPLSWPGKMGLVGTAPYYFLAEPWK